MESLNLPATSPLDRVNSRPPVAPYVIFGYVLATLMFLASGWTAFRSVETVRSKGAEASDIFEFLATLRETFSLIQDMETGQRGYVLTRRPEYLQPYENALAALPPALHELGDRDRQDADNGQWRRDFELLIDKKVYELAETIRLIDDGQDEQALAMISQDQGRKQMDEIRRAVADRQTQDLARLRGVRDDIVASIERAALLGAGATMLGLGMIGASFYRMRNELAARKALADDLHRQREALQITLFSIGDGVITTDERGRVQSLNGMAEQLTGWRDQDARGRTLETVFDIINESSRERVENPAVRALREGRIVGLANHTLLIARDGAERAIDDSAAPIRGVDGKLLGAVLVFRDVTEQRRSQATLLDSQRRKDDFLAMLAHELRNPLAGILSGVQVLRVLRPEGDAAKMQEVIERQAAHMARMVDDLLDTSRFARGKLVLRRESLDLRELIRVTVEDYRHGQLIENCELNVELPQQEVWVWGDPTRLAQAASNLIHNGCKFCDGPNSVTVSLRVDEGANCAEIAVSDRGIGMDAKTLATVFQPFMQADTSVERSRGGLGLGLALVQALVSLHEGQVFAHSDGLGEGSRFTIRLPLSLRPMTEQPPAPLPTSEPRRVVIIDDRRDAVMPLQKILQMNGHEVRVAVCGVTGVDLVRSFVPNIVLCDIGLPEGMSGYDVARALRADTSLGQVYLVAVTGYGQEEDRQLAQAAGFDYHVTKPVGKDELLKVIHETPRFSL